MRKLFYEDINITDFTATVVSCEPVDAGKAYRVLLDATAFFPQEGGQSADKGTLNGQTVTDVQMEDDKIYHYIGKPLAVGTAVSGHVDWEQRFDFMQQHSGEHIVSGLVHKHFGYHNVGFHLSVNEVTLDFDGALSPTQLQQIENEANRVIFQNIPVQISYPTRKELSHLSYRSKIEITGQVRIVTIPGVDVCACCAPHVACTGSIGMIKITGCISHRGGVRLNILCGQRALDDYNAKQTSVTAISTALSAKQNLVMEAVLKLKEENLKQKEKYHALQAQYLSLHLSTLPSPSQTNDAILFVGCMDTIAIRNAVNELTAQYTGYCGIFSGNEDDGYQFIIGSKNADCTALAQVLRQEFGAKCGGSIPMIQGSIMGTPDMITPYICSMV